MSRVSWSHEPVFIPWGHTSQGWRGGRNMEGEWGLVFSEDRTERHPASLPSLPLAWLFSRLTGPSLVCGGRPSIRNIQQQSLHQAVGWQFKCRVQETGTHPASGTGSTFSILFTWSPQSSPETRRLISGLIIRKLFNILLFSSYGLHGAI